MNQTSKDSSRMNEISNISSSSETRDKRYFYTVREENISYHAKEISKMVQDGALTEIPWTEVVKGAGNYINGLIVFVAGTTDNNRAHDVLSGIREQASEVQSIIAVIICTSDVKDHAKFCSSTDNHTFRTEKDISFEYFIFSDGTPHECSNNIHKRIEDQLKEIETKIKNEGRVKGKSSKKAHKQTSTTIYPERKHKTSYQIAKEKIARTKMNKLVKNAQRPGKTMNDLEALEKSIIEFNVLDLKEDADLLHAKNVLNNGRVEIVLKDAILRGRTDILEKAIKMATESGFIDDPPVLSKAKQELDKLNNTHNPLEITPKTITELRGYTDPSKVIHDVMRATFMLLGENQHDLEVWQTIQYLIRQPEKLLRQIKNFDEKKVSRKTYIDVMEIFQRVDEVGKASLAAEAFRNWDEKVLASIMPTPFKGQNYSSIKKDCLEKGVLFEDPEFPAYSEVDSDVEWKRPSELCEKPKLVVDGKTSDDLNQGELGNCWFVTACASLAHEKVLFQSVVPNLNEQEWNEKSDKPSYAGIFHFQFWRFGEWTDVVVDDRLPTKNDNLIYCHSKAENEFWSSLVEKAYAKLYGGYASLKTGRTEDALVDFTGAMAEKVILSKLSLNEPKETFTLFRKLRNDLDSNALLTCIIDCPVEQIGTRANQGLIKGHGYNINKVLRIKMDKGLQGEVGSGELMMLRLSNPWGPSEWTGPWSNGAPEWQKVKQSEWQKLGLSLERDEEFWMAFDDFVKHFSNVDIHHFENTSFFSIKKSWHESIFHGEWNVSGRSGSSEINSNPVFSNPQFMFDIGSQQDKIMVSLEQHDGLQLNEIGFQIMKVEENRRYRVHINRQLTYDSDYMQSRSIFGTTELKKGRYVLIPTTKNPVDTGKFMVRLCTGNLESFKELTEECPKGKCKCVKNSELATTIFVVPADGKVLQEEEKSTREIWKSNMPMDDYITESRIAGHGMGKQNCYIVPGSLSVVCKA